MWAILIAIEPSPAKSGETDLENWKTDAGTKGRIAVAGFLSVWITIIDWAYLPESWWISNNLSYIGLILLATGATLRIWAVAALGIYFDSKARVLQEHRLIRGGPFRIIRHPCYLGSILIFIGSAVFLNSLLGILASCLLMVGAYRKRIEVEEALLMKKFPQEYPDLADTSWKLFPFIY